MIGMLVRLLLAFEIVLSLTNIAVPYTPFGIAVVVFNGLALLLFGMKVNWRSRAMVSFWSWRAVLLTIFLLYAVVDGVGKESGRELFDYVYAFTVSLAIVQLVDPDKDLRLVSWAVAISFVVVVLSIYADFFLDIQLHPPEDVPDEGEGGRAGGLFINPNAAAAAVAMLLGLGLSALSRIRLGVALFMAMGAFAIVLTNSRSGMVQLAVVIAMSLSSQRSRIPYAILGCLLAAGLISTFSDEIFSDAALLRYSGQDESAASRLDLITVAFDKFAQSPLWGNGIGSSYNLGQYRLGTHNIYLALGVEFGIFVVLGYVWWCLGLWRSARPQHKSVVAAFAVNGFFSHNVFDSVPLMLVVALIAATAGQRRATSAMPPADPSQPDRTAAARHVQLPSASARA